MARFYGESLRWALDLPLPELIRWNLLRPKVAMAELPTQIIPYRPRD